MNGANSPFPARNEACGTRGGVSENPLSDSRSDVVFHNGTRMTKKKIENMKGGLKTDADRLFLWRKRSAESERRPLQGGDETMSIALLKEADFDASIASGVVLVDFFAEWCGPCRMVAPALEEIAAEMQGKIRAYKVNVDENPALAARFQVRSIPDVILFKDGKKVKELLGAHDKAFYVREIQAL